jgi:hypothetical protein
VEPSTGSSTPPREFFATPLAVVQMAVEPGVGARSAPQIEHVVIVVIEPGIAYIRRPVPGTAGMGRWFAPAE